MELVKLNIDLVRVNAEAQEKATRLNALAVTQSNCLNLEELRTKANKEIKAYKASLDKAEEEYLKPFAEAKAKALEAIQPYEEATKKFSASILEAKKARKNEELKNYYILKTAPTEDGEVPFPNAPTFERCIDGLPSSASLTQAKDYIYAKLLGSETTEEIVSLKGSKEAIEKLRQIAIGIGIEWELAL